MADCWDDHEIKFYFGELSPEERHQVAVLRARADRRADVAWAREIKEREEREREEKERGRLHSQCTIPLLQIGGPPK